MDKSNPKHTSQMKFPVTTQLEILCPYGAYHCHTRSHRTSSPSEFTDLKDHSCYTLMLLASLRLLLGQVQQLYINIHTWTYASTDTNFPAIQSTQQSFTDYEQASLPPHSPPSYSRGSPLLRQTVTTKQRHHFTTRNEVELLPDLKSKKISKVNSM